MAHYFAAVDIGSNAIRLIISRYENNHVTHIKKFREPIRLGGDVFSTGSISDALMDEVVSVFVNFKNELAKWEPYKIKVVATSAMRDAKNCNVLIQKVKEKTGLSIEVISGKVEAELIQNAIHQQIDLTPYNALLVDIGGGSLELTIVNHGKTVAAQSFQLGTVRVLEKLKSLHLNEDQTGLILSEVMPSIIHFLSQSDYYDFAIGTGGNLECIGELKQSLLKKDSKTMVTYEEVDHILKDLHHNKVEDRIKKWKLREDRADVIYIATYIISIILRQAEIKKLALPYVGLRDGIILSLIHE